MPARLDHIVICAADLDAGAAHVEAALGIRPKGGGAHLGRGSHNRLLSLGPEAYLEVIAPNPADSAPAGPRMFDLDHFTGLPRLSAWVARTDDMARAMAAAPPGLGAVEPLSRGDLRWQMSVPPMGKLPFGGLFPALISWQGAHPAPQLPDHGLRLARLVISHPEAPRLARALAPLIGDPRLELRPGPPGMLAEIDTPQGRRTLA